MQLLDKLGKDGDSLEVSAWGAVELSASGSFKGHPVVVSGRGEESVQCG